MAAILGSSEGCSAAARRAKSSGPSSGRLSVPRRASFRQKARHARATGSRGANRSLRNTSSARTRYYGRGDAHQQHCQRLPSGRAESHIAEQLHLAVGRVTEHPLVPGVRHRVQGEAQRACSSSKLPRTVLGQRIARRYRGRDADLDARRRNRRGRVHAQPARILQPHLRPGVRFGLAHDHDNRRAGSSRRLDSR